jgi:hypothetical protein
MHPAVPRVLDRSDEWLDETKRVCLANHLQCLSGREEERHRSATLSSEHQGVRDVAEAFGYSPEELSAIPAEARRH